MKAGSCAEMGYIDLLYGKNSNKNSMTNCAILNSSQKTLQFQHSQ